MRRSAVAESVVHRGEFRLDVFFSEPYELESLDHYLRIVVSYGARGQLDAVYHEVVLVCLDGQRINFARFCLEQHVKSARRH